VVVLVINQEKRSPLKHHRHHHLHHHRSRRDGGGVCVACGMAHSQHPLPTKIPFHTQPEMTSYQPTIGECGL